MTELTITLLAFTLGIIVWSLLEQRRTRTALDRAAAELVADRAVLAAAAAANATLGEEMVRQRDQLASLEMRLGAAPSRGFTQPR